MPTTTENVRKYRAQYAALNRDRSEDDPERLAALHNLVREQCRAANNSVLDAVQAAVDGQPTDQVRAHLDIRDVPVAVRLHEAVALLAHLVRYSDRPTELITALRAETNRD